MGIVLNLRRTTAKAVIMLGTCCLALLVLEGLLRLGP
jgi:hypothetical protein